MAISSSTTLILTVGCLLLLAGPAHAFGAGNIASMSAIEGTNWRHGDIEDTLLQLLMSRAAGGKKFDKMAVARVYFGNWLRDYSQAIDVGIVKNVSAEAVRILLWVLGFMTFGYGTGEFEVTSERLGCYRPEDHIDNPKDYADNLDAREYDPRLRGPVDESLELAVDPESGMKNYIANERAGCMTSAEHVRKLFTDAIEQGRSYARSGNKDELYESLRLLGTGCHCLEDYSAHSNFVELALIEMGERDVFPHVGRNTRIQLDGARNEVYPLITGTFGGVDFLHSMMGEFNDKATQSEIQQLEDTIQEGSQGNTSLLKELLSKIPDGLLGGDDQTSKADELQQQSNTAAMQAMHVTPKEPEEWTLQIQEIQTQIMPIMEYHDKLMKDISSAIENIPILPEMIEQLENEINVFVFSLLAPFVLPLIQQLKLELNQGSSEVIASSTDKQLIVFNDDDSTDPTHSMLSKDHFSNVLNEPAGKIASGILSWAVPQLIKAMDNENVDVSQTVSRIISGVFHHPAQRDLGDDGASDCRHMMYQTVQKWWQNVGRDSQQDLRRQLSRDGVLNGENHKPGEHDTGHGSAGGMKMHKHSEGCGNGEGMIGELLNAFTGGSGAKNAGQNYGRPSPSGGRPSGNEIGDNVGKVMGGGILGGIVGGVLGEVLGNGDDNDNQSGRQSEKQNQSQNYENQYQTEDGGYRQESSTYSKQQQTNSYQQQQYSETTYTSGRKVEEYKSYEQNDGGRGSNQSYGYEARVERRGDGEIRGEERFRRGSAETGKKWKKKDDDDDDDDYKEKKWKKKNDDDDDDKSGDEYGRKREKKHHKKKSWGEEEYRQTEERNSDDERGERQRRRGSGEREKQRSPQGQRFGGENYGRQEQSYDRPEPSYGGGRGDDSYRQQGEEGREYRGGDEFGRPDGEYRPPRDRLEQRENRGNEGEESYGGYDDERRGGGIDGRRGGGSSGRRHEDEEERRGW